MLPAGYMAKKVAKGSENRLLPERITDIYSVSHCISPPFDEKYFHGKINEFRFFDSPGIIATWADENAINLTHFTMFYFEIFEFEFLQTTPMVRYGITPFQSVFSDPLPAQVWEVAGRSPDTRGGARYV